MLKTSEHTDAKKAKKAKKTNKEIIISCTGLIHTGFVCTKCANVLNKNFNVIRIEKIGREFEGGGLPLCDWC